MTPYQSNFLHNNLPLEFPPSTIAYSPIASPSNCLLLNFPLPPSKITPFSIALPTSLMMTYAIASILLPYFHSVLHAYFCYCLSPAPLLPPPIPLVASIPHERPHCPPYCTITIIQLFDALAAFEVSPNRQFTSSAINFHNW